MNEISYVSIILFVVSGILFAIAIFVFGITICCGQGISKTKGDRLILLDEELFRKFSCRFFCMGGRTVIC